MQKPKNTIKTKENVRGLSSKKNLSHGHEHADGEGSEASEDCFPHGNRGVEHWEELETEGEITVEDRLR